MKTEIGVEQFAVSIQATYEDGSSTKELIHPERALGAVEDLRCPAHSQRVSMYFAMFGLYEIADDVLENGPALADALEKAANEAQEAYADHLRRIAVDKGCS